MDLKGYSAWVSVDGNALKEYNIEITNGDKATCWIPSEAGKASGSCRTVYVSVASSAYTTTAP